MVAPRQVADELEEVFQRRITRAPAALQRSIGGGEYVTKHVWLTGPTLMMFVGGRSSLTAAMRRQSKLGNPFPKLFGAPDGDPLFHVRAHGIEFSGGTLDVSESPIFSAFIMAPDSSLIITNETIVYSPGDAGSYSINILCAYHGSSDQDTLLFGPDKIVSLISSHISRSRRDIDVN